MAFESKSVYIRGLLLRSQRKNTSNQILYVLQHNALKTDSTAGDRTLTQQWQPLAWASGFFCFSRQFRRWMTVTISLTVSDVSANDGFSCTDCNWWNKKHYTGVKLQIFFSGFEVSVCSCSCKKQNKIFTDSLHSSVHNIKLWRMHKAMPWPKLYLNNIRRTTTRLLFVSHVTHISILQQMSSV